MIRFLAKIRIVPVTIFAAALMLSFKVGDILNGIESSLDSLSVARVQAQTPPPPPEAPPPPPANLPSNNAPPPEEGGAEGAPPPANQQDAAAQPPEGLTAEEADPLDDPTLFTQSEMIKTHDQQEDAKMQSLVKIYENMKPKDAARIFEELDINTLLMVAERMKERKLAPVMAKMNSGKAKEMTVELSKLRKLPDPGT